MDNNPASAIQKEGEKVTGGTEANQDQPTTENTQDKSDNQEKSEYTPATETTKEEMTGYNELPEQEKVGGA